MSPLTSVIVAIGTIVAARRLAYGAPVTSDLDLVVLGDANPDIVLHGGDVVPAFGQAEHLVESANITLGGSGGILASGAAKLGLRVAICAVVGDDLFGRFVTERLAGAGVDTGGVTIDASTPTGVTVVLSGPDDRAILTMPGTVAALGVDAIDRSLLDRARHVHVSSYYLQRRLTPELPAMFDDIRASGSSTSLDPNWDPAGQWDAGLVELLDKVDVFLPNAMEATRIAHTSDIEAAVRSLASRARLVAVKNGEHGAIARDRTGVYRVDGLPTDAVDTTGAGDSFDAGFLAAWLGGGSIDRALALGNACGSLSTRAMGGVDAQPTMDEALALLAERSLA
jgi:sugar/nucleoside kinase (ribokinase family)